MPHKTVGDISTNWPEEGSLELTEEYIRLRAYYFFEERGCEHGHDLEDWLRAEGEIMGKKPSAVADRKPIKDPGAATVAKSRAHSR